MASSVLNSTVVLRLNFCTKLNICAPKFATALSCETLAVSLPNYMIEQVLKYDFPKNNPDPFDESFEGGYFASANGFSNLSDNLIDFSFDQCGKHIPMGYKTLLICYRIALIRNGVVVKSWELPESLIIKADSFNGKYLLQTNSKNKVFVAYWNRHIETATVLKPFAQDGSLKSMLWDDKASCLSHGTLMSCQIPKDYLVSVLIEHESWH